MRQKTILFLAFIFSLPALSQTHYKYKVITAVESIVPGGVGRSRIVDYNSEMSYKPATITRNKQNNFKNNKVKRKNLKIDSFDETKLLNFYSMMGINFQNIASNDALISSKLTEMSKEGWELFTVISGVESDAGKQDGYGIFITRFIFRKPVE
jgi:hypothetical protein